MKKILLIIIILLTGCSNKVIRDNSNKNIIGYLEIPNVFKVPVVQYSDNIYYLNHDINNKEDIKGSIFMDYRNNINDRKVLIYGHSGNYEDLPFLKLNNYSKEDFFKNNDLIYFYISNKIYKYRVFSTYIEYKDFDYMNLNSFNNLTYLEHINKLKNNSMFYKDIELDNDSKIIILQTCSMDKSIKSKTKYRLVIGKLIKVS